jgi:5-methylcytosine-specific restriction endonuclease McrA
MARANEFTRTTKDQAFLRQKGRCAMCGGYLPKLYDWYGEGSAAHHIRRVADGGSRHLDNCVILCETCHLQAHDWGKFRRPIEILRKEFRYLTGRWKG